jgi:hypothetical protein
MYFGYLPGYPSPAEPEHNKTFLQHYLQFGVIREIFDSAKYFHPSLIFDAIQCGPLYLLNRSFLGGNDSESQAMSPVMPKHKLRCKNVLICFSLVPDGFLLVD